MTYIPSKKDRDLRKRFGDRLAMARMKKGLTQEQLAGMIGRGTQTISNWESGYYYPKEIDTLLKLAETLECDPDFLLDRLDESTHDIHFVHEFTGLSEEAIKRIRNPELDHPYAKTLSRMIETDRFDNLITTYKIFLNFLEKIETEDLERVNDYQIGNDQVILGRNEAANHFKQEVSLAMIHLCEDNYSDRVQKIIQDIPTPFTLSMEPFRARVQKDTEGDE